MIKAKNKPDSNYCTCNNKMPRPSLDHGLCCPRRSIFLLYVPSETFFKAYGYGKSVTIPNSDTIKKYGDHMAEMMRCDCGHWFPRWQYSICPNCLADH